MAGYSDGASDKGSGQLLPPEGFKADWLAPLDSLQGVVNNTDPDHLIPYPGFGFWPRWYAETFRNVTRSLYFPPGPDNPPEAESNFDSNADSKLGNMDMCNIAQLLYKTSNVMPVSTEILEKMTTGSSQQD